MPRPTVALRHRLAELRGPGVAPRPLDARALAALAANPGCRRRALLDGAGVDKGALADALGAPTGFGQSQFAHQRGHVFEARVTADGGAALPRLLLESASGAQAAPPEPDEVDRPDVTAADPEDRVTRTRQALRQASDSGRWAVVAHPMVRVEVAGAPAYLEPDAVLVHPDGGWTVVEIKSFPMVDGSADPAKVGAAARQAAVYALALQELAAGLPAAERSVTAGVRPSMLLVCPENFSNTPTAALVDVRKQVSVTRRQLGRLARVEEIAGSLPAGTSFDVRLAEDGRTTTRPAAELLDAVERVSAAYTPDCLAACELAFHCRARARQAGAVETLGRAARGELGGLRSVAEVLAAAEGSSPTSATEPTTGDDTSARLLRRAAELRTEALNAAAGGQGAGCH